MGGCGCQGECAYGGSYTGCTNWLGGCTKDVDLAKCSAESSSYDTRRRRRSYSSYDSRRRRSYVSSSSRRRTASTYTNCSACIVASGTNYWCTTAGSASLNSCGKKKDYSLPSPYYTAWFTACVGAGNEASTSYGATTYVWFSRNCPSSRRAAPPAVAGPSSLAPHAPHPTVTIRRPPLPGMSSAPLAAAPLMTAQHGRKLLASCSDECKWGHASLSEGGFLAMVVFAIIFLILSCVFCCGIVPCACFKTPAPTTTAPGVTVQVVSPAQVPVVGTVPPASDNPDVHKL